MHATWCLVVGLLTVVSVVFTNDCDMERVTLNGMDTSHNGIKETLHTVVATLHNTCISTGCKEACCSKELCNTAVFSEGHNGGPCTCLLLQCNPIASCKSIIGTRVINDIWVRYVTNKGANSNRKKRKTSKGDKHKRDEKGVTGSPGNATKDTAKKDNSTNQTKRNATTTNNKVDKQATEVTSSKSENKVTTQSTPTTHGVVTTGTTQKSTSTHADQKNMTKQEQILQAAIDKSANTVNNTKLSLEGHNGTNSSQKTIVLPTPSLHLNIEATTPTGNVTVALKNTSTESGHTSPKSVHSTTTASTNTTKTKQVPSESSTKHHPSSTPAANVTGQGKNATTTAKSTTKVVATTPMKDAKTKKPVTTASPITNGSHPAQSTTPSSTPSMKNNTVATTTTPTAHGHSQKSGNASSSSNNSTKKETTSSKPEVTTVTTPGTNKSTTHKENTSPSHKQTQTTSSSSDQKNHTTPSNHKGKAGKVPTSSAPAGSPSKQNTSSKHGSNRNASKAAEAVKQEEHDAAVLLKDILEGIPDSNHSHPVNGSSAKSRFSSSPKHMTVVLIAFLCIGTLVVIAVVAILGKLVLEGWKRRHYSRVDFLVNGMYH